MLWRHKKPAPVTINLKGIVVNRGDKLILLAPPTTTQEQMSRLTAEIKREFGWDTPCVIITNDWRVRVVTKMPDRDELAKRARQW